jgi:hypothetical protein
MISSFDVMATWSLASKFTLLISKRMLRFAFPFNNSRAAEEKHLPIKNRFQSNFGFLVS